MKNLLYKEWRLAMHPASLLFLGLSAMLLIPNYPYYVTFFYTTLGIFFICLTGRENHDLYFSACLPVKKEQIVTARVLLAVQLQLLQLLLAIPFAVLRQSFPLPGNEAGMDANIALFGLSLGMLGLFNLVFFTRFYRAPQKVGKAFVAASVCVFVYMALAEACVQIVPFFKEKLDTPDDRFVPQKLAVLAAGLVCYLLLTWLSLVKARRSFAKLDL